MKVQNLSLGLQALLLAVFVSTSVKALTCSTHPIKNTQEAESCAQEFLNNAGELYNIAENKGHLGDLEKCANSEDISSYYSEDKEEFESSLGNGSVENCAVSSTPDEYVCWIKNTDGCWIKKENKGQLVTRTYMRIGKTTGNLITFIPIQ